MRSGRPDIVVLGGSAGSIEALKEIVQGLPRDLPAALFVVVHLSPTAPSALPTITARSTKLAVRQPVDGDCYEPGTIYIAPPDYHLVIDDEVIRLTRGPRENRARPSVDVLFRSAGTSGKSRVVGVLLSGNLNDGAAGLAHIRSSGGVTIVQDPVDAVASGMPEAALSLIRPDRVLPASEIAAAICEAVDGQLIAAALEVDDPPHADPPTEEPGMDDLKITCPDCSGVLDTKEENGVLLFECQVGHRFSEDAMLDAQADGVEAAMWVAVRTLEERVRLAIQMARRSTERGHGRVAERFLRESHDAALRAEIIRRAIASPA